MAAQLQPQTSPLSPTPTVGGIIAAQPKRLEELQEDVTATDKKVSDINAKEGAMKMPELQTVPQPTVQQTDPSKIWGSAAMLIAGLGGLMTRRPFVTAMNAATQVFKAYKENDQSAANQAFQSWKIANENALKMADFQQKQYKEAMDGYEKDKTGALAELRAKMVAFQDATGVQQLDVHGIQGAESHMLELKRLNLEAQRVSGDLEEKHEQHMALMEAKSAKAGLVKAQATNDPKQIAAAKQKFDAAMDDIQTINKAYGKGGTGNLRSLPAAFAQKYLAEHPDATAEDLQNAAAEYTMTVAEARGLGTRTMAADYAANEAGTFAEQALDASKAVPRADWKAVNDMIQKGQTETSNPALRKLLVATDALVNARARAISPTGVPHVSDQEEGRKLLSAAQSETDYAASVDQMIKEVQGVKGSGKQTKEEIFGKGGGPSNNAARGPAPAHIKDKPIWPDGDHWIYEDGSAVK